MDEQKQRECLLKPEWIRWWRETIRVMEDQGQIVLSNEVIYRVNHSDKMVILVNGQPQNRILDQRYIEALGYKYEVFMDPTAVTIATIQIRDPRVPVMMRVAPNLVLFRPGTENPSEP